MMNQASMPFLVLLSLGPLLLLLYPQKFQSTIPSQPPSSLAPNPSSPSSSLPPLIHLPHPPLRRLPHRPTQTRLIILPSREIPYPRPPYHQLAQLPPSSPAACPRKYDLLPDRSHSLRLSVAGTPARWTAAGSEGADGWMVRDASSSERGASADKTVQVMSTRGDRFEQTGMDGGGVCDVEGDEGEQVVGRGRPYGLLRTRR